MKPLTLNKPHLLIMVGIPGSGKSYFAEQFSDTFKAPFVSFNRLRQELFARPDFSKKEEAIVNRVADYMLDEIFKTSQTAIFEGQCDTRAERTVLAKRVRDSGYVPMFIWVQTEPLAAKRRALKPGDGKLPMSIDQFNDKTKRFVNLAQSEKYVVISGKHTYVSQLKIVLKNILKTQTPAQPVVPISPVRPQVNRNILIR